MVSCPAPHQICTNLIDTIHDWSTALCKGNSVKVISTYRRLDSLSQFAVNEVRNYWNRRICIFQQIPL
ncbi:hypothetical protein RB195_017248 [Necator americanus]